MVENMQFGIEPVVLNKEFIKIALSTLPQGDCNENTLSEWVKNIRQTIDIKAKDLFMQLRLALTGTETGPELAKLLIFIGRESIIARLEESQRIIQRFKCTECILNDTNKHCSGNVKILDFLSFQFLLLSFK